MVDGVSGQSMGLAPHLVEPLYKQDREPAQTQHPQMEETHVQAPL